MTATPQAIQLGIETKPEVDRERRIIRGKIAAYGKASTSARVVLSAGALRPRMPLNRVKLLIDHNMGAPVGFMLSFDPSTLDAEFKVPEGEAGDKALDDAEKGLRDGMSVGIMPGPDSEILPTGETVIHDGEMYEVSLVAVPDFEDARVESVTASLTPKEETMTVAPAAPAAPAALESEQAAAAAAVAAGLTFAPAPRNAGPAAPVAPAGFTAAAAPVTLGAVAQFRADIAKGGKNALALALDPIIQADVFDAVTVPAFVGELWKGKGYTERFTPLFTPRPLTAQEMTGWRWVDGMTPDVFDYAGNLVEVGTNEVKAEAVPFSAGRSASAHKVDRIHVDMPNPAFWESFYRERATNYSKRRDAKALAHLINPVNRTAKTVPAGTDPWAKLFRGALWVLEFATPEYAVVGADLYEQMALTTDNDKMAFLEAQLGLEGGTLAKFKIVPAPISNVTMNGKVVVGSTFANELYELPGGPIRVDQLDVANGGVDTGVFGYDARFTTDIRGVVEISEGI